MADTVGTQVIQDGARNYVVKFTNISDGTGESAVTKITVANLSVNPDGRACTDLVLQKINGYTDGVGVDILWDATTPLLCVALPKNEFYDMSYIKIGGLPNNGGAGKTGNVKISTRPTSSVTVGATYSIVLQFSKVYPN